MPWWLWLILVVLVAGLAFCASLAYRVAEVRRAGTPVLFRPVPAAADQGWRHGSVHYTEPALVYYRLSSLRPGPTATLSRRSLELVGRRTPVGTELEIMDPETVVLELRVRETGRGAAGYEVALDPVLVTALLSWLEARPPSRARRPRRGA